jgi:hypothetical protein
MRVLRPMLIMVLVLAGLAGAPSQAARRLTATAPATAEAGGLRGPVSPTTNASGALPTSIYSPLPAGAGAVTAGSDAAVKAGLSPMLAALVAVRPAASATAGLAPGAATTAPLDPTNCRMSCGRGYYFCLAGGEPTDCPSNWTRCLSACAKPLPVSATPP